MPEGRDRQKAQVKAQFLEAAQAIIMEEGIAEATAKKIGARSGFSYATIYNYFPNLNALLCEAVDALNRGLTAELSGLWDRKGQARTLAGLSARVRDFAGLMLRQFALNRNAYYPFIGAELDFGYFKERDGKPYAHPAYALLLEEISAHRRLLGLDESGARVLSDVLAYVFHAKMHFFLRYGVPDSLGRLEAELEAEINLVLSRAGKAGR